MHAWRYHNPVPIHFGVGSIEALPGIIAQRNAVLVTFEEAATLGFVHRVQALLGQRLRGVMSEASCNPDAANLCTMYKRFWDNHADCDVIVALGGGSALDTAKLLSVRMPDHTFMALHCALVATPTPEAEFVKPCIAIPTTAGTGSEVTPYATLWDATATPPRKLSLQSTRIFPEAAIVDPALALSLPATPTLHSGLDALSHSLEAIWNVNANPVADALAVTSARSVLQYLPLLMKAPRDVSLRSHMAAAALTAGLAFSTTRTALAHSISYEMTMRHGLPHGLACSFTLPMVLEMAIGRDPARDAVLASVFDGDLENGPKRIRRFLEELSVPTRFAAYGVSATEEAELISLAQSGLRGRNFVAEVARPRECG